MFKLSLLLFLLRFHLIIIFLFLLIPHDCLFLHHLLVYHFSIFSLFNLLIKSSSHVFFRKLICVLFILFFKLKLHISLMNILLNCLIFSSLTIIDFLNDIFSHPVLIFFLSRFSSFVLFNSIFFLLIKHFNISLLNSYIFFFFFLSFLFSLSLAFIVLL